MYKTKQTQVNLVVCVGEFITYIQVHVVLQSFSQIAYYMHFFFNHLSLIQACFSMQLFFSLPKQMQINFFLLFTFYYFAMKPGFD